ncbi:MAG TPA: hypothetical protein VI997_07630, partial [Candidatus Thermoplasmatota archaeon]|nr:hypothetical protein [Candidatus Thermoplasmatota archaeon]
LANLERWKQREFAAAWERWGKLVWTMEQQAAWICTNLGDAVQYDEICFIPFDARLRRLKAAKAAKDAREAAAPAGAPTDEGGAAL